MAYYKLAENLRLRGWERLPWAVVDADGGEALFLGSQREMDALSLCNGKIDVDLPLVDPETRKIVDVLVERGFARACEPGDAVAPVQEYRLCPNRYISTAHWSVTGRCNYRCRHCYMSAPDAKLGEIPHEEALRIVDELAEAGVAKVTLTGGEPLVRGDFLDIVDALLAHGILIDTIYSNGKLVNERLLRELDARGIHPEFNMSYDAPGWHDWLRGVDGAEVAVDRAFRLCHEMGFPTGAEMCIHEGNKHLIRETVNHLAEVGCSSLKTNPVSDVGAWHEGGLGQSIATGELFGLYLDYIPAYYEDGMPLSLMLGGLFQASPRRAHTWDLPLYHYPKEPQKCVVCGHARSVTYISPEGRTLPCMALSGMDIQEEFPLVGEVGLSRCLSDSRYMDFIDTRADAVLEHNPGCAACAWRLWCQGGCRASGLEASGQVDLLAPDPASCMIFRGGWGARLVVLMRELRPEDHSVVLDDAALMELFESQPA